MRSPRKIRVYSGIEIRETKREFHRVPGCDLDFLDIELKTGKFVIRNFGIFSENQGWHEKFKDSHNYMARYVGEIFQVCGKKLSRKVLQRFSLEVERKVISSTLNFIRHGGALPGIMSTVMALPSPYAQKYIRAHAIFYYNLLI